MKKAVVYYSLEGNIRYVAEKVAEAIGADSISLVPAKAYPDKGFKKFLWGGKAAIMKNKPELEPYSFNADDYEMVVLCTPVWAGTFTPPFRTFLDENAISGKKVAIAASSTSGNAKKCIEQLKNYAGVESIAAQVSLVDPKTRPSQKNEERIRRFIHELKRMLKETEIITNC